VLGVLFVAAAGLLGAPAALPSRFPLLVATERLPLPASATHLVIDPLAGTIELRLTSNDKAVAAKLAAAAGQICPRVRATDGGVAFTCRTNRIDARLSVERGRTTLVIEELRGLPWRNEADRVPMFYDPVLFDLGGPCPGTTHAGRAECLLAQGRTAEAAALLQQALKTPALATFAALRLGDIALGDDDPTGALDWYRRAGVIGLFGRLASLRRCEILDGCSHPGAQDPFAGSQPREPLRTEVRLRRARLAAFDGRFAEAVALLAGAMPPAGRLGTCTVMGMMMCRRVLLSALAHPGREAGVEALETYLALPDRNDGPLAVALVRAAADKAAVVGAPLFGGRLLAASVSWTEGAALADHLLRAAELYSLAGDPPRTRVMLEYAETRFPRGQLGGARWNAVRVRARAVDEDAAGDRRALSGYQVLATESARDVAGAYGAVARARGQRP
jgi:hypothetical protein